MYLVKTPWLLKQFYSGLLWNEDRDKRIIYLTFDDGPIPVVTPFVLKILKQYQAKATFFCIGDNIRKHPDVFEQVKADGHAIGNHTFHHLKGWKTEDNIYIKDMQACQELTQSNLFRPPYGRIKKSQAKTLQNLYPNLKIIMWDVLSGDFDMSLEPERCLKNVVKHTENGSIVVFHDSLKAFNRLEYVLPRAMEYWSKEGYQFKILL
ncbi:polysaccharide deacetylase family protein [Mucilaginibacter jinjuensis]|uniref:Polysaccharide deacetylase family protein n=1 Tax=Mucilaginibacter jinjuensis TaxID=1176721 RepID=A0ABY7T709_9SPHI|nr:polysaccharide deacetylase family protein [Mucilaginibacter jinjuensis]WCT11528.1 polysaccharide deacetylase family protein [Mucilaginibacter jinjuensis]